MKKNLVVTYYDTDDEGKTTKENTVTLVNYFKQKAANRLTKIVAINKWGALEEYGLSELYNPDAPETVVTPETDTTTVGQTEYEAAQQQAADDAEALANYKNTVQELNNTQQTLESTQTELTNTQNTLSQTETTLQQTQQTLDSTQTELTNTQNTLQQTETTLQETQTNLNNANQTITNQTNTINNLTTANEELTTANGELQGEVANLTEANEDLQTQVTNLENENQTMKETLVNLATTTDEDGNYIGTEYKDVFRVANCNTTITSADK